MMKNILKLSGIFSVASVAAVDKNDLLFDDENVDASRDYLKFLTKKYRAMAAIEDKSDATPYEERLSRLRLLASHAGGCNATNGSNGSNGSNSSNASTCGNGTNGTAANATAAPVTTAAPTTKAATKAPPQTTAAPTKAPTTKAPTTKAPVQVEEKEVITVKVTASSKIAAITLPANSTATSFAADTKKALESNFDLSMYAINKQVPTGTVDVKITVAAAAATQRRLSTKYDMSMDWTLTYKVDDLDAAKGVVSLVTEAQKKLAEDDTEKAKFVAAFNKAFTDSGATNPAGANGLDVAALEVTKDITFEVTTSKDPNAKMTTLTALDAAIEAAKPTTKAAETKAAAADTAADATQAADETSGAFQQTAIATVFMTFASIVIF